MNFLSEKLAESFQKYKEGKETVHKTPKRRQRKRHTKKKNNSNTNATKSLNGTNNSNSNNNDIFHFNFSRKTPLKSKSMKKRVPNSSKPFSQSKRVTKKTAILQKPRSPHTTSKQNNDVCDKLKNLGQILKNRYHEHLVNDSEKHLTFQERVSESEPGVDRETLLQQLDSLISRKKNETVPAKRKEIIDEIKEIEKKLSNKSIDKREEILQELYPGINNLHTHPLFMNIKRNIPQYYVPDESELDDSFSPVINTDTRVSHLLVGIMFESIGLITKLISSENDTHIFLKGGRALQIQGMPKSKSFDLDLLIKSENKTKESKMELALCIAKILLDVCSLDGLYDGTGEVSMKHDSDKNLIKIAYLYTYPGALEAKAEALVDITYHQETNSPTYEYFNTGDNHHIESVFNGFSMNGRNYHLQYTTQKPVQMFLEKLKIMETLCTKNGDKLCLHDPSDNYRVKKSLSTLMTMYNYAKQSRKGELTDAINKYRELLIAYKKELMEDED
jgi:hypothetical protein